MDLPKLIGVIHLQPLPGSPLSNEDPVRALALAGEMAVNEAKLLRKHGFDGLMIENFNDVPFYKTAAPPETVAAMAVIAGAVKEASGLPCGINVLRNDGRSALAIAAVTGCEFVRVNVLSGAAATDQGIVESAADFLLRERRRLGASVALMADAQVKHARSLSSHDIALEIEDLVIRQLADAVIVTGPTTGRAVEAEKLLRASQAARAHRAPLYIGSGARPDTLAELLPLVDGIIVGSSIRKGGKAGVPLDAARVRAFAAAFKKIQKEKARTKRRR